MLGNQFSLPFRLQKVEKFCFHPSAVCWLMITGAVVLAAGKSERMGQNKLLGNFARVYSVKPPVFATTAVELQLTTEPPMNRQLRANLRALFVHKSSDTKSWSSYELVNVHLKKRI